MEETKIATAADLNKTHWDNSDKKPFLSYLTSLSKGKEKAEWEKRIVNTNLPCLAVPCQKVNEIVKQIAKGNFVEFINLWITDYFTCTTILGGLIPKVKDLPLQKKYLIRLGESADSWATTDAVKIKPTAQTAPYYLALAKELLTCPKPFSRRLALILLLKLTNFPEFNKEILLVSASLKAETEYYVNMANAWLVAECFIKSRNDTLPYLQQKRFNKFTQNKAIQKCRDSFRVTAEDKALLNTFKIN